jgi:hypothetical protein
MLMSRHNVQTIIIQCFIMQHKDRYSRKMSDDEGKSVSKITGC